MIVTVTAHPSIDRTVSLAAPLRVDTVQEAVSAREDVGGKGVNVSGVIDAAGARGRAVVPLAAGDPYGSLLQTTGLDVVAVPVVGTARVNLTIVDPVGATTKINLPGARFDADTSTRFVDAVVAAARGAHWLVLAGSLPPGADADLYVRVIRAVRAELVDDAPRIAVDTSGAALREVVQHGAPDLIKPNDDELADLVGHPLDADVDAADAQLVAAVHAAALELVPSRVRAALVTLGGAGAVLITEGGAWHAAPPPTTVRSTVGAGDSSLAGYLLASTAGVPAAQCLEHAVRYGSAAAALPGTQPPRTSDLSPAPIAVAALRT